MKSGIKSSNLKFHFIDIIAERKARGDFFNFFGDGDVQFLAIQLDLKMFVHKDVRERGSLFGLISTVATKN